jgi:hypothetical protein
MMLSMALRKSVAKFSAGTTGTGILPQTRMDNVFPWQSTLNSKSAVDSFGPDDPTKILF